VAGDAGLVFLADVSPSILQARRPISVSNSAWAPLGAGAECGIGAASAR
jgi:hypothetical protein